jgi:hypothetical protein
LRGSLAATKDELFMAVFTPLHFNTPPSLRNSKLKRIIFSTQVTDKMHILTKKKKFITQLSAQKKESCLKQIK